jgi:cytochrome P450
MSEVLEPKFRFDPFSAETTANTDAVYKRLRDEQPVYYNETYDTFFFSRFEDVWELLRTGDNTFLATELNLPTPEYLSSVRNDGAPPYASVNPMSPGNKLPSPFYEEMRAAHIEPLRPKSVAALQDKVREQARMQLDLLLPKKRFDLFLQYAAIIPARMICGLFDLPYSIADTVMGRIGELGRNSTGDKKSLDLSLFWSETQPYIVPAIQARRKAGADGSNRLIDGLINWRAKDDGRALSDAEISDQLVCVMVGGLEAVPKVTARGIMELWNRPDQLAAVRADLDNNLPVAVEEMIRFCAPAVYTFRTAHKDAVVGGQKIRAGQRVCAMLNSASRDDREFQNPDEFVWNREIPRVLSFGMGQHHCIGKHLAVMEIRIMVREFLERVRDVEFHPEQGGRNTGYFQRGWTSLPVVINDGN